jgi:SAM-dependent methyltransferase
MSSAAERIIDLYQQHAGVWDRQRGNYLLEKSWLDRFLALVPPKASLLDIGCGSGRPIARYLIEMGYQLTGIDSSATLIALCKDRFPSHTWIVADMRKLSLHRRFQGLFAWDSFFHLCPEDQRPLFSLFKQHAAPGAALLFTSGHRHGEIIASWQGEPLYHGSLETTEYRALLEQNDFAVISHVVEDPSCGQHTVWLAQHC